MDVYPDKIRSKITHLSNTRFNLQEYEMWQDGFKCTFIKCYYGDHRLNYCGPDWESMQDFLVLIDHVVIYMDHLWQRDGKQDNLKQFYEMWREMKNSQFSLFLNYEMILVITILKLKVYSCWLLCARWKYSKYSISYSILQKSFLGSQ